MPEPTTETSRPARAVSADDILLPFGTVRSRIAGRIVRLGAVADGVLGGHGYPEPVSHVLGEALALTALLGHPVPDGGRLILQTKSDGAIGFLVVQYDAPGALRGYASFDAARLGAVPGGEAGQPASAGLLGSGRLAMTIDPGGQRESWQGIVGLDGASLADAAHAYFRQSEQLPTFIRLAVARQLVGRRPDGEPDWRWRAGGLMVQHVPVAGGDPKPGETPEERDQRLHGEDDDGWRRVATLAATVEEHELIDPTLSPERLLLRLFHEEGVRVGNETQLSGRCRCSRERIHGFLRGFPAADLVDMREADGAVSVKCEFCSQVYRFTPDEIVPASPSL
jgi:molecular chaperone Hsp33